MPEPILTRPDDHHAIDCHTLPFTKDGAGYSQADLWQKRSAQTVASYRGRFARWEIEAEARAVLAAGIDPDAPAVGFDD